MSYEFFDESLEVTLYSGYLDFRSRGVRGDGTPSYVAKSCDVSLGRSGTIFGGTTS